MPPVRAHTLFDRDAPRFQTCTPTIITAFFLRQIEANHVRTPSRGRPVPLQFNSTTQSLSEWAWPCNPDNDERVPPSELEAFRRTHRFRSPSCLCALLEGTRYTECRIGIVETVTTDADRNRSILNGEYVASCAKKRCGYFLCLERFYSLNDLKLQVCFRRKNALEPQELASICDIDQSLRAGDGLFQLMTDVVVRGPGSRLERVNPEISKKTKDAILDEIVSGMSEQRFWATFVQCLVCKSVTLRKNFALGHICEARRGRVKPYAHPGPDTPSPMPTGSPLVGSSVLPSSPVPTEVSEDDAFGDLDHLGVGELQTNLSSTSARNLEVPEDIVVDDGVSDGVPSLVSDDFELPTLAEILSSVPRRVIFDDA